MRACSAASGSLPFSASTAAWIALPSVCERSGQRLLRGSAEPLTWLLQRRRGGLAGGAVAGDLVEVDDRDDGRRNCLGDGGSRERHGCRKRGGNEQDFSLELSSYVEAEEFGVVALLLEKGLGEIDAAAGRTAKPS